MGYNIKEIIVISQKVHYLEIPASFEIPPGVSPQGFGGDSGRAEAMFHQVIDQVKDIARPKAVYMSARVNSASQDTVDINGVRFRSRILSRKIGGLETVYPFIVTVGPELDGVKALPREMWQSFILDSVKTLVLINAVNHATERIKEEYNLSDVALMNPGEIQDWPISEQLPLFRLFGGEEKAIGVSLSTGGAMRPLKSRSGIVFPDDTGFVSCRFCTQPNCPGRRAAYDPKLVKEFLA